MSERSELRRRREKRMENGVKNLKGARLFPKTFSNHGFGDASFSYFFLQNIHRIYLLLMRIHSFISQTKINARAHLAEHLIILQDQDQRSYT